MKKKLLNSIDVKTPCRESWDEMFGNDEVRFCSHCAKDVHNLSAMTRHKAEKIIRDSNGKICVRYTKNPQGEIITAPPKLTKITRRATIAVSVLATTLSLSTIAYSQGDPIPIKDKSTQTDKNKADKEKSNQNFSTISGDIFDPAGALVPGAKIILKDTKTKKVREAISNDEGSYNFNEVVSSVYEITILSQGFQKFTQKNLKVLKNTQIVRRDIVLSVSSDELVGMLIVTDDSTEIKNTKSTKKKKN